MDARVELNGDKKIIYFAGSLTIESADQVKAALLGAIESAPDVEINFGDVTDIDLSCLQLLCSAHRTSVAMEKNLTIASTVDGALQDAASRGGFIRHTGCSLDARKNCLWMGIQK